MVEGIDVIEHQTPRGEKFAAAKAQAIQSDAAWSLRLAYENGKRHGYRRGFLAGLMLWAMLAAAGVSMSLYHTLFR